MTLYTSTTRRFLQVFFTAFFCTAPLLMAQTTGKIAGKITDKDTGQGLPGANVILDGTNRGAAADLNGEYFVINVPPGVYDLRVQMIGYEAQRVTNVRVSVNRTSTVDVRLQATTLAGEEGGGGINERAIRALAEIVDSPAGMLWRCDDGLRCDFAEHWSMPPGKAFDAKPDAEL
ncbi:carboxypeptidase-like regulatory domain-containing protein, partial [Cytophagia bacterium CHB2]|nr:carboxypeptidase-like regulatory domain-containing protein [Cytophagia bacterium CHB2]